MSAPVVLLVDDQQAVRQIAAIGLRLAGFAVLETGSAEQALDLFRRREGARSRGAYPPAARRAATGAGPRKLLQ
jgi:CheY-like chemotaxis protein